LPPWTRASPTNEILPVMGKSSAIVTGVPLGAAALAAAATEAAGAAEAAVLAAGAELATGAALTAAGALDGDAALVQAPAANETATTAAIQAGPLPRCRMNEPLCMSCLL
jgi:hypothetical protein